MSTSSLQSNAFLLTVGEVAEYVGGVHPETILRAVRRGELKPLNVRKGSPSYRFFAADVEAYLRGTTKSPTTKEVSE